jgi:hypothetical protein
MAMMPITPVTVLAAKLALAEKHICNPVFCRWKFLTTCQESSPTLAGLLPAVEFKKLFRLSRTTNSLLLIGEASRLRAGSKPPVKRRFSVEQNTH